MLEAGPKLWEQKEAARQALQRVVFLAGFWACQINSETLFQLKVDYGSNKARMLSPTGVSISTNIPQILAFAQQTHMPLLLGA